MSGSEFFGAKRNKETKPTAPAPEAKKEAGTEPAKKAKKVRKSPFYASYNEAMERLHNNGLKVYEEQGSLRIVGEPGIKLLGAIDYLRKGYTVRVSKPRKEKS